MGCGFFGVQEAKERREGCVREECEEEERWGLRDKKELDDLEGVWCLLVVQLERSRALSAVLERFLSLPLHSRSHFYPTDQSTDSVTCKSRTT